MTEFLLEDDDDDREPQHKSRALPTAKSIGRELSLSEIKFCSMVAAGLDYKRAYRDLKNDPEHGPFVPSYKTLSGDPSIQGYINDLRVRAAKEALGKTSYEIQDAMQEASLAFALAVKRGDAKAMVQATMLKSKIMGLLTEDRRNDRGALKDLDDPTLEAHIDNLLQESQALNGKLQ